MALFMDSDFSLLKPDQQKDVMDFKVLFGEQNHCGGEFSLTQADAYLSHFLIPFNAFVF